jgi:hypothetical protein
MLVTLADLGRGEIESIKSEGIFKRGHRPKGDSYIRLDRIRWAECEELSPKPFGRGTLKDEFVLLRGHPVVKLFPRPVPLRCLKAISKLSVKSALARGIGNARASLSRPVDDKEAKAIVEEVPPPGRFDAEVVCEAAADTADDGRIPPSLDPHEVNRCPKPSEQS